MPRLGGSLVVTTSDPAANTEISQTVTAGKYWRFLSASVQMVQGATQTPWPSLVFDDGTSVLFQGYSGTAAMSASTTTQHSWAPGNLNLGSAASVVNTGSAPNGFVLGPGYRIRTVTTGIGANSNYGVMKIYVVEFDGPPFFDL